jgi:hypothetical protein
MIIWPIFVCHIYGSNHPLPHKQWSIKTERKRLNRNNVSLSSKASTSSKLFTGLWKQMETKVAFTFLTLKHHILIFQSNTLRGIYMLDFTLRFLRFHCLKSTQVWNETRAKCIFIGQNNSMFYKNAIQYKNALENRTCKLISMFSFLCIQEVNK